MENSHTLSQSACFSSCLLVSTNAYVNNVLTEHKHKHKREAYTYAYACLASEDRPLFRHITSELGQILSFIFFVFLFLQTIWKSLFVAMWRKICHYQQNVLQYYYL